MVSKGVPPCVECGSKSKEEDLVKYTLYSVVHLKVDF